MYLEFAEKHNNDFPKNVTENNKNLDIFLKIAGSLLTDLPCVTAKSCNFLVKVCVTHQSNW